MVFYTESGDVDRSRKWHLKQEGQSGGYESPKHLIPGLNWEEGERDNVSKSHMEAARTREELEPTQHPELF